MNQDDFLDLVGKYLQEDAKAEDITNLEKLRERKEFNDMFEWLLSHWNQISNPEIPAFDLENDRKLLLNKIQREGKYSENKIVKIPTQSKSQGFTFWLKWAAVISLIAISSALILIYIFTQPPQELVWQEYKSDKGERISIQLDDGTEVVLHSDTKLRYPKKFTSAVREVFLEGEAFFKVSKNPKKPFVVNAGKSQTTVLGTQFNVSALPGDSIVSVALLEGKVEVVLENGDAELLKPRQQWVYLKAKKLTEIRSFNPQKVAGWKDNVFVFDKITLGQVSEQLGRHFGVNFNFQDEALKNNIVKTTVQNESLEKILEVISGMAGVTYEIEGKDVLWVNNN